jgi:hypothetical protein
MKTWVVDIQWYLHMVAELAGNNKRYQEKKIYIGYSNSVYPFWLCWNPLLLLAASNTPEIVVQPPIPFWLRWRC